MATTTFLRGDRLTLRPVEPDDHAYLTRRWNEPTIRHWTNRYDPITEADIEAFLEDETAVHFVPCRNGDPVGFVWLFYVSDVNGTAEIGYWIEPAETGQGYGTEAARLCLRYAFDERNLRRVTARVFEGNDASVRILETLGFREEGRLREHYYVDGAYVDALRYGLLEDEYRES